MTHSGIETLEVDGVTVAVLGIEHENLGGEKLTAASDLLLSLAKSIDPPRLLLDLSRTRFFGSGMLGVILRVWNRVSTRGVRWPCAVLTASCDVLKVTKVERLWTLYDTQDDGIKGLNEWASAPLVSRHRGLYQAAANLTTCTAAQESASV